MLCYKCCTQQPEGDHEVRRQVVQVPVRAGAAPRARLHHQARPAAQTRQLRGAGAAAGVAAGAAPRVRVQVAARPAGDTRAAHQHRRGGTCGAGLAARAGAGGAGGVAGAAGEGGGVAPGAGRAGGGAAGGGGEVGEAVAGGAVLGPGAAALVALRAARLAPAAAGPLAGVTLGRAAASLRGHVQSLTGTLLHCHCYTATLLHCYTATLLLPTFRWYRGRQLRHCVALHVAHAWGQETHWLPCGAGKVPAGHVSRHVVRCCL